MLKIENIFLRENSESASQFENDLRVIANVKVGEIYRSQANDFTLHCTECLEKFGDLPAFVTHIEEHFPSDESITSDSIDSSESEDISVKVENDILI